MSTDTDFQKKSPLSVLRQFTRERPRQAEERCDLCGAPIGPGHAHLLNISTRQLQCVCQACRILFDRPGAGGRRLVPNRYRYLSDFEITDQEWDSLGIPVNMAFFFHNTPAGRVAAFYPGPAGPMESLLPLETWTDLENRCPSLKDMEPDVEALLVNRVGENREYFVVPIDECYKLVGLIRLHWKGMSGGRDVWKEIAEFFAGLKERARPVGSDDARP